MKAKGMTRREAVRRILKMAALAAGLSAAETRKLLARVQENPDLTKLIGVKAQSFETKALKVLLMPRSRMPEVFRNEFGRALQSRPVVDRRTGTPKCEAFVGISEKLAKLTCTLALCNALTCEGLNCPKFAYSTSQTGAESAMTCFSPCVVVPGPVGKSLPFDPFIQALFREFNVTSSQALHDALVRRLSANR